MHRSLRLSRRTFAKLAAVAGLSLSLPAAAAESRRMARRVIPATGEEIPVIGLGTSDEFDRLPPDGGAQLKEVLETLVQRGGSLIDTAPGYGDAERILGGFIEDLELAGELFLSTKVREQGSGAGARSLARSRELLRRDPLDLIMVHSLVDADTQLDNLEKWRDEGHVRLIGITTSRSDDFEHMEALIRRRDFDFIQVNYSPFEREAAQRVIPAAAERGVAVMVNRAFGNGAFFQRTAGRELPAWAAGFDCESWAQMSLKYILANPAVTCVLTATSNPRHMADNAAAGIGRLPDAAALRRIETHLAGL